MIRRQWTRDELIAVLKLYCITPFGRLHSRNADIIALAESIGRTASAVALKMTNFASLDPTLRQSGMSNHSKLDEAVWAEFFDDMGKFVSVSEPTGGATYAQEDEAVFRGRDGLDVLRLRKTRVNQDFFRSLVLASYDNRCALTGIDAPELLVASHIVPWSEDASSRTNPANGICLNALHDRAFDLGLMTFEADLTVRYSTRMPTEAKYVLSSIGGGKLRLPRKFIPDPAMLNFHRANVFVDD